MKKNFYTYIWFILALACTPNLLAKKNRYQWVDPRMAIISTSPGDVAQKQVMQAAALQDKTKLSPSYIEALKAAVKKFRACLVEGACSEQERSEAVDMANNLLDLVLLTAGVGIVETGEFIEKKVQEWKDSE